MPVILRIAFRNLLEHKVKSLIIGTIIALGVVIIIVGNAFIDTAALGIKRSFIDNYTGHLIVTGTADGDVSIFGVEGAFRDTIPVIPEYARVREHIATKKGVASFTSQITSFGSIRLNEFEGRTVTMLFGIEPETYGKIFNNLRLVEGEFLKPGQEGIILSKYRIENLISRIKEKEVKLRKAEGITEDDVKVDIKVGDPIVVTCMSNIGLKIREVPLVDIVEFITESEEQKYFSFIDVQTLRALLGMTISTKREIRLEEKETSLLALDDPDALFGGADAAVDTGEAAKRTAFSEESLLNILQTGKEAESGGSLAEEEKPLLDTGAWNFILIKLKNSDTAAAMIKELNNWFIDQGITAVVGDWKKAAGPFATTADVVRIIFMVAITVVGIVAIFIIINTLMLSIIERTSEIGTMRALGARKSFVWKLFITETLILMLVFGIIGIVLSGVVVIILHLFNIQATNAFMRILFAGPALKPQISFVSILISLGIVVGFGLLTHIYPVYMALKIRPIQAIKIE